MTTPLSASADPTIGVEGSDAVPLFSASRSAAKKLLGSGVVVKQEEEEACGGGAGGVAAAVKLPEGRRKTSSLLSVPSADSLGGDVRLCLL